MMISGIRSRISQTGVGNRELGAPTYYFGHFFYRELREIEKHFTEGRVPSALH